MPRTYDSISDINESVIRPIVTQLAETILANNELKDRIGLSYKGSRDISALAGSKLNSKEHVVWANDDGRAKVIIQDRVDPEREASRVINDKDGRWICNDPDLRLGIYPVYERRILTLTINYRDASKQNVEQWRDTVRRIFRGGLDRMQLEATYSYAIPSFSLAMMRVIHAQAQLKLPLEEQESIGDWYGRVLTRNIVSVADIKGQNDVPHVKETQVGIVGFLTEPDPEIEVGENTSQSSVEFVYEIHYECPKQLSVNFPIFVNNSRIPKAFIPRPRYDTKELIVEAGNSAHALNYFSDREKLRSIEEGIKLPYYDEWSLPKYYKDRFLPIITIAVMVNPDETLLLNLGQLGRITLRPELLEHLRRRHKAVTGSLNDLFNLTLFENDDPIEDTIISLDADLNVHVNTPLNIRKTYRLVLSMHRRIYDIPKEHINDLRFSGNLLKYAVEQTGVNAEDVVVDSNGVLKTSDYLRLVDYYANYMNDPSNGYQLMITVCTFLAVVGRR